MDGGLPPLSIIELRVDCSYVQFRYREATVQDDSKMSAFG